MTTPHTPPTQAELDALKKLDAEATPGPFVADINIYGSGCKVCTKETEIASVNERLANLSRNQAMANAMFFAHARTALPRLITEVERLTKEVEELRSQNVTFRNAQKACEDCDGITKEELNELRKDKERLDACLARKRIRIQKHEYYNSFNHEHVWKDLFNRNQIDGAIAMQQKGEE